MLQRREKVHALNQKLNKSRGEEGKGEKTLVKVALIAYLACELEFLNAY